MTSQRHHILDNINISNLLRITRLLFLQSFVTVKNGQKSKEIAKVGPFRPSPKLFEATEKSPVLMKPKGTQNGKKCYQTRFYIFKRV